MTPLILTAQEGGERLDAFVASQVEDLTRSAAQRLLEQGAVTSGGKPLKKNAKTTTGMVVEVLLPDPQPVEIVPQNIPLDVVYEDDDVIVVNKPVGAGGPSRSRTPRRHLGQRPALPLRGLPVWHQR